MAIEQKPLPTYSTELIEELDAQVRVTGWSSGKTLEELAFAAGQRSIVDHLLSRLRKANKNILEKDLV